MGLPPFIKQTALRTGAIFLVKMIGISARIPLFRMLGSEGTGIYQIVYSVYGAVLTLLTGGFSTSLALLTAKDKMRGWQFFKGLVIPLLALGGISSLIFYAIAPSIARLFGDSRLEFSIRCVAPALFIVPLLQLFRGFLQGIESYGYIAASEMIEQTVRIGTMLLLSFLWMKNGIYAAAGGAVFGAFTGACIALWFLWMMLYSKKLTSRIYDRTNEQSFHWYIVGPAIFIFLKTSFAITLTRLIMPASDFLDALIIPNRLQVAGLSPSKAIAIYGEIYGMASTIVYIPTIVTAAISYTIAAKLAASWQNKKLHDFAERSRVYLEIGWLWGLGAMLFLTLHADELSNLIFGSDGAAIAIRYMSFAPLIAGMRELTVTILWASDQKKAPLTGLLLGLICSITLAYFLTAIPGFGYAGAAISVLVLEFISFIWNAAILQKKFNGVFPLLLLAVDFIFLAAIGFVCTRLEPFLLQIGIGSASIRSFGSMLIFIVFMALYMLARFWKKTKRS